MPNTTAVDPANINQALYKDYMNGTDSGRNILYKANTDIALGDAVWVDQVASYASEPEPKGVKIRCTFCNGDGCWIEVFYPNPNKFSVVNLSASETMEVFGEPRPKIGTEKTLDEIIAEYLIERDD